MRPGMSVKAEVEAERREGVVLVPRASLALDETGTHVVLADGARQSIELGACNATACEVRAGLEAGVRLGRRG
jgi:multidrug efflux pump subunit AcrA (membrane-fusion protein)